MEIGQETSAGNIRVFCRFRPLKEDEIKPSATNFIQIQDSQSIIIQPSKEDSESLLFQFDHVFTSSSQASIYEKAAKPIVESVMLGFNGTVFAYGQTASGKTHTMTGPNLDDVEQMGIIPRMVSTVFYEIDNSDQYIEFTVKVSYCELYMEHIQDLLDESKTKLKIREDRARGVYIDGLNEVYTASAEEVYELMKFGGSNRTVGAHKMNERSSRSHSIFSITISQTNTLDYSVKVGKMHLVDLAGSEKVDKTGAEGTRLEEAKKINKSLTSLGIVINALSEGKKGHIPYRDSKLTRILQDSLGGNALTSLIITCSPSLIHEAETISSLRFGVRAKLIKNTPKINKEYTVSELKLLLAEAKDEIKKKDKKIKKLEEALMKSGISLSDSTGIDETFSENETKAEYIDVIQELEEARTMFSNERDSKSKLKAQFDQLQYQFDDLENEYQLLLENYKVAMSFETIVKEKEEIIERLNITQESIQSEFTNVNEAKLFLEHKLMEKEVEIEFLKKRHESSTQSEREEKEKIIIGKYQDSLMHIDQYYASTENLSEYEWKEDRKRLSKDLHARIRQLIELEIELEDLKDYLRLQESLLPFDAKEAKKKNDILERRMVQLSLMYHQLVNQKSSLVVEKQVYEAKLRRLSEKLKISEDNYYKTKVSLKQADEQIKNLMEEVERPKINLRSTVGSLSCLNSKIIKPIKGGKNHKYSIILDQDRTLSN